jgi:tol-pal system protein YbgF
MRYLSKALVTGGLVILTGPLCLVALAQSYVDVEAERAAAGTGQSATDPAGTNTGAAPPPDPYSVQPAQSYPATSYGVGAAPPAVTAGATGGPGGQGGQNLGNLFYQIQQLQQEVMRLNGKVEEQAHELRKVKEQNLQRYVDLDRRLSSVGSVAATTGTTAAARSGGDTVIAPVAATSAAAEEPGEGEAYRAAYALVRGQQFDDAVGAFRQFLQDYPEGKYAPNAHYWLGELYLVVDPPDLESSRQSFVLLLDQYPDNSKAPDAMYKLGKVYYLKGNREKAREYMDRVIRDFGASGSSAVKLAQDFLAENY